MRLIMGLVTDVIGKEEVLTEIEKSGINVRDVENLLHVPNRSVGIVHV